MFVRYISRPLDVRHGAEVNRAPPSTPALLLHPQPHSLAPIGGSGSDFFYFFSLTIALRGCWSSAVSHSFFLFSPLRQHTRIKCNRWAMR